MERCLATSVKPSFSNTGFQHTGLGRGELDELEAHQAHGVVPRGGFFQGLGGQGGVHGVSKKLMNVTHCRRAIRHDFGVLGADCLRECMNIARDQCGAQCFAIALCQRCDCRSAKAASSRSCSWGVNSLSRSACISAGSWAWALAAA